MFLEIIVTQLLKLLQLISWYSKFVCKTSIYNKVYLIIIIFIVDVPVAVSFELDTETTTVFSSWSDSTTAHASVGTPSVVL